MGTAQKSPQIHKIAAASCCDEKSLAITMPGIEPIDEYHEVDEKIDIAIARNNITAIVAITPAMLQRSGVLACHTQTQNQSPDRKNARFMRSIAHQP